jgi:hypothetical protein
MAGTYTISLAARVPAASGPPTLTEVDRLVADSFSYTDELNRPGAADLSCKISSLSSAVKARLINLAAFPSEVWIYRDSTMVWAGEIQTGVIDGQTLKLNCAGLLGYTFRMGIEADVVYSGVDQFTIAQDLIDDAQALAYGNYGLITTGIGTSGVVRDRRYLASELNSVGKRLQELAAVLDGFDMYVIPANRVVVLSYPSRGTDLSASVFLDKLNIDSASVAFSVAPDDLVTDVLGTGTGQDVNGTQVTITSQRSNATLRASYGRSWAGQNFDGVIVLSTLNSAGDGYLGARNGQFFQPGISIIPRVGAGPADFAVGDTLTYAFDAGLGMQTGLFRVGKRKVSVDASGKERMALDFA